MRKKLRISLITAALCALCAVPAHALEYRIDAPQDYLFGEPTSDATIYEWENPNVDRSKNTALIAPGFGTPTSYLPNSGELLTPNLVAGVGNVAVIGGASAPSGMTGAVSGTVQYPRVDTGSVMIQQVPAFTQVTRDFYFANGSLGTIKIPSIGLTVGIYEGTTSAAMSKGAGHFEGTSIWNGNVAIAGVRPDRA